MAPNKKPKQKRRKEKKVEAEPNDVCEPVDKVSPPAASPEPVDSVNGTEEKAEFQRSPPASHTPKPIVPVHVRHLGFHSIAMLDPDGQGAGRSGSTPQRVMGVPRLPLQQNANCLTRPPPLLPPKLLASGFVPDVSSRLHLGSGAYASVRCLRHATSGHAYALKILEKEPLEVRNMMPQLKRELGIQNSLRHKHILRVVSIVEDPMYVYMLLDFCGGGTLRSLCHAQPLKRLPEPNAARFFYQILQGVEHMHNHGVVHRDPKGDNILLTHPDLEVRICDFGWSAECSAERALLTTCGTPEFWAPEQWNRSPQGYYTDIWAVGCLMYEVLVGHQPFWGSQEEIRQKVLAADVRYPPGLSEAAVHLMFCHFQLEPENRAPAAWSLRSHGFFAAEQQRAPLPPLPASAEALAPVAPGSEVTSDGSTNSGSSRSDTDLND